MKKHRKNSGFTLVECVVAMAVLAVMALGLLMILSVTVRQRNANTQIERDVDSQVDKVVRNAAGDGGTLVEVDDINLSDSITISGVKKIYFDNAGSGLEIGALQIEGDAVLPPVSNPKPGGNAGTPNQTAGSKYRVYGLARLKDDTVNITQQGAYVDNGDGTYTVTWRIVFSSYGEGTDTSLVDVVNMGAVKVVFPSTTTPVAYAVQAGNVKHVYYLGENTVRIEPGTFAKDQLNAITVDIDFVISASDYKASLITDHFGSATPKINKTSAA